MLAQKSVYDSPETGHPFYWAAFVLIGDGGVSIAPSVKVKAGAAVAQAGP